MAAVVVESKPEREREGPVVVMEPAESGLADGMGEVLGPSLEVVGEQLMSEFEHLYTSSSRQDWEKRLDSLRQAQAQSEEEG